MRPVICIIDDDPSVRDSLKLVFEIGGYDVLTFASGPDLFSDGASPRANCFVLDVNLPGDSGFDILSRLRAQGVLTPAVFVSGRATADMRVKARSASAPLFEKPVPPSELLPVVAQLVSQT